MSAPMPIEVRNLAFATTDVPPAWHGGRRAVSLFFDNLSLFFPAGERFFVTSVKAHRHHVRDPKLAAEVRAFCAQEGVHGREHVHYNQFLEARGLPARAIEARVQRLLDRIARRTSKRFQLAVTCALEHFTAIMAETLLGDPRTLDGAHPEMAAMWRWHAAEESEHKAVAFDVYQAAGGGYALRILAMIGATLVFWAKTFEQQVRLMAADRSLHKPREWWSLFKFLFITPGGLRRVPLLWLSYFRPRFHPSHRDNRALLDAWRAEYAASPSYEAARQPRRVGASAEATELRAS
jgi:uncharacterized protein